MALFGLIGFQHVGAVPEILFEQPGIFGLTVPLLADKVPMALGTAVKLIRNDTFHFVAGGGGVGIGIGRSIFYGARSRKSAVEKIVVAIVFR